MTDYEGSKIASRAADELGVKLMPSIYQDLLQPAAREIGERLVIVARAVSVGLAPLEVAVWGYDRVRSYISAAVTAKLAKKKTEDIRAPDPVIAGPAIANMVFAAEVPGLREMYATLLAHAMHAPSSSKVHPSFAQVIHQLSPVEAQLLSKISAKYDGEDVLFDETLRADWGTTRQPYIYEQWRTFCASCGLADTAVADAIYYNLIRLGIFIERSHPEPAFVPDDYALGNRKIDTRTNNYVMLTAYGALFLDACLKEI